MSDETIRGAANQVWETAGAVERAVNEVLAAHDFEWNQQEYAVRKANALVAAGEHGNA